MPGDIKQTSKALEKGRLQAGLDILELSPPRRIPCELSPLVLS